MFAALKAYICRLLDANDANADCMAFGILLGFIGFNALFAAITGIFVAHAFFPARVDFKGGETAAMITSMAGSYSAVLTSTAAAYRWRKPVDAVK